MSKAGVSSAKKPQRSHPRSSDYTDVTSIVSRDASESSATSQESLEKLTTLSIKESQTVSETHGLRYVYPDVLQQDTLADSVEAYQASVDSYQPIERVEASNTAVEETKMFYLTPKKPVNELEALKAEYERQSETYIEQEYRTEADILRRNIFDEYETIDQELIRSKQQDLPKSMRETAKTEGEIMGYAGSAGLLSFSGLVGGAALISPLFVLPPFSIFVPLGSGFAGKAYAESCNEKVVQDVKKVKQWFENHVDGPPADRTWRTYDFSSNGFNDEHQTVGVANLEYVEKGAKSMHLTPTIPDYE